MNAKRNVFCTRRYTLETCHWTQFCFAILSSEHGRRKRKRLCDTVQPEAMVNRASSPSHSSRMKNDGDQYWSEWLVITDEKRGAATPPKILWKFIGSERRQKGVVHGGFFVHGNTQLVGYSCSFYAWRTREPDRQVVSSLVNTRRPINQSDPCETFVTR